MPNDYFLESATSLMRESLETDWTLASTEPGECSNPEGLHMPAEDWFPAAVPGTVAMTLWEREADPWQPSVDYDTVDWWYKRQLRTKQPGSGERVLLRFAGLATFAEVWLNGERILSSENMFRAYAVDVTESLHEQNELAIVFRSVTQALSVKRPRPNWKTRLVENQQLRWIRTTLLGRIPSWTPPIKPVGPWREVYLERVSTFWLTQCKLRCALQEDSNGRLSLAAELKSLAPDANVDAARLLIDGAAYPVDSKQCDQVITLTSDFMIENVAAWWPHTHGEPRLLNCRLQIDANGKTIDFDCGKIGFKSITLDRTDGRVQFVVNGTPIFCRGACWTINDFVSLSGTEQQLRRSLELARHAGVNMLRVGGTMVYESDRFYELCDELGILVWQDFMFANMDYPVDDAEFMENVSAEVKYQLQRLSSHVSIAAYCGNSEVQQQAAMFGIASTLWSNSLFDCELPKLCEVYASGIPYFPSTPCEGSLPFHVGTGLAHYFGVGAYQRPIDDVIAAQVKFSPECLAFSNIPEAQTIVELTGGDIPFTQLPVWKGRVPRDAGVGWDFEDVRDHYLQLLFQQDPATLRYTNPERYTELSRAVSGEVMASVFSYWRSSASACGGGLVWFYKDLWPGAGWGIIDSENRPKAAYYYLRRVWKAQTVLLNDKGLDGLELTVFNDSPQLLHASIEYIVLQEGKIAIATASEDVALAGHSAQTIQADKLLGRFLDSTYAYRFGPVKHDVVACLLFDEKRRLLADSYYFPNGLALAEQNQAAVATEVAIIDQDTLTLSINSNCFLQTVRLEVRDYLPEDNYFHLAPHCDKRVTLNRIDNSSKPFRGYMKALNMKESLKLKL